MAGSFKRGVFLYEGKAVVHSCYVAERAEKKHKKLLENNIRSCAEKLDSTFTATNFIPTTYIDINKHEQPAYLLTLEGCLALTEKMRGTRAKKVREHFNKIFNTFTRRQNNKSIIIPTEKPETTDLGVFVKDGKVVVSSWTVADVFEKRHDNVVDAIKNLGCGEAFSRLNFKESKVLRGGKEYTEILMTRDGLTLLAMGFTGAKAMRFKIEYISAFNAMEAKLKASTNAPSIVPNFTDPISSRLGWIAAVEKGLEFARALDVSEKKVALLTEQIEEDAPKVDLANAHLVKKDADSSIAKFAITLMQDDHLEKIMVAGQLVEITEQNVFKWLVENKHLTRLSYGHGYRPMGKAKDKGYIRIIDKTIKPIGKSYTQALITPAGDNYFRKELKHQETERNQLNTDDIKLLGGPDQNGVPQIDFSQKRRKAK